MKHHHGGCKNMLPLCVVRTCGDLFVMLNGHFNVLSAILLTSAKSQNPFEISGFSEFRCFRSHFVDVNKMESYPEISSFSVFLHFLSHFVDVNKWKLLRNQCFF
jgi:hypothetical protein